MGKKGQRSLTLSRKDDKSTGKRPEGGGVSIKKLRYKSGGKKEKGSQLENIQGPKKGLLWQFWAIGF